jgi:outer membrane lipoprotein-sorting protein
VSKLIYRILIVFAVTAVARGAPASEADLKNVPAEIRQNRTTQADFQEERVMRLMKKPVLSSGAVWFQPPNESRREVKGSSPSLSVSDGRDRW